MSNRDSFLMGTCLSPGRSLEGMNNHQYLNPVLCHLILHPSLSELSLTFSMLVAIFSPSGQVGKERILFFSMDFLSGKNELLKGELWVPLENG